MNRKLNDWQTALAGIAAAITGIIMAGRSAVNAFSGMGQEKANGPQIYGTFGFGGEGTQRGVSED